MKECTFNFWETFRESYTTLLKDKNSWILIAGGPWLLALVAVILTLMFGVDADQDIEAILQELNPLSLLTIIAGYLISFVALVMFQVRALRYKLLGDLPSSLISLEWKMRHWKMIGNSILVGLAYGIPTGLAFGVGAFFMGSDNALVGTILFLLGALTGIYILARFYLFSPIVAIEGSNPLKTSWELTRGWTWLKFLALIILVSIPAAIVLNLASVFLGSMIGMWLHIALTSLLTTFVLNIITNSAFASVYKQLSGK